MNTQETQSKVPDAKELAIIAHHTWLQHPVTRQLFQVLSTHESSLIDNTNAQAGDIVAAVRTVRAMRKVISDSTKFVTMSQQAVNNSI